MGMRMMFTVFLLVVLTTTVVSFPSDRGKSISELSCFVTWRQSAFVALNRSVLHCISLHCFAVRCCAVNWSLLCSSVL
nr:conotoxin A M23.3 [Conus magus]